MDNTKKIYDTLIGAYNNHYGVCALMGNLRAESALISNNAQNSYMKKLNMTDETYTQAVDNGEYTNFVKDGVGYGLAQWTYWSRKQNLLNYARQYNGGVSIGDLEMQLSFLIREISGYKSVYSAIVTATNIKTASDVILTQFERPADQSDAVKNKRAKLGEEVSTAMKSTQQETKPDFTEVLNELHAMKLKLENIIYNIENM